MAYKGTGSMTDFVESWNTVLEATRNTVVVQVNEVLNPVFITVKDESITIDFS